MDEISAVDMNNFMSVEQSHSTSEAENIADFQIKDGVLVTYLGSEENVIIPDFIIEIGTGAFSEKDIKTVTIPDSVKIIGKMAFFFCTELENIYGACNVELIDDMAFYSCQKIKEIELSDKLKKIGVGAFTYNCLHRIILPESLIEIQQDAFRGSQRLKELSLNGQYLKKLGISSFSQCISIETLNISAELISIPALCFEGCWNLTNVVITGKLEEIADGAFSGCARLEQVALPNSITRIKSAAFWQCTSLKEINIPSFISEIESQTFGFCNQLQNISLPPNLTRIGFGAFQECTCLKCVHFPENLRVIESLAFFESGLEKIIIPRSVKKIGQLAFGFIHNDNVQSISVESDIIELEENAICSKKMVRYYIDLCKKVISNEQAIRIMQNEKKITTKNQDIQMIESILELKPYNTKWKDRKLEIKFLSLIIITSDLKSNSEVMKLVYSAFRTPEWDDCKDIKACFMRWKKRLIEEG
ncbi:MAG: leucine-rich repeat domain-containing protein [Lachnospiraceae bacterium]|nr:leucine-rich repeat domain-containing protein [Lachnospiraceae bacterium]